MFLALILALFALSQGRWVPLVIFNGIGLMLGWQFIPAVFSAMGLLELYLFRRYARAGHGLRLE